MYFSPFHCSFYGLSEVMVLQNAHGSFMLWIHREDHRRGAQSELRKDAWLIHSLWSPVFAFHSLSVYFILLVAWLLQWIRSLFELHNSSVSTQLPLSSLRVLLLLTLAVWTLHNHVRAALCASPSSNIHNWIPSLLRQRNQRRYATLRIWLWWRREKVHNYICFGNLTRNLFLRKRQIARK